MGGRARLASDQAEFYEYLRNNETWQNFYSALNSKAFIKNVIDIFSEIPLEKKLYALVTIGFYMFSIYQNTTPEN